MRDDIRELFQNDSRLPTVSDRLHRIETIAAEFDRLTALTLTGRAFATLFTADIVAYATAWSHDLPQRMLDRAFMHFEAERDGPVVYYYGGALTSQDIPPVRFVQDRSARVERVKFLRDSFLPTSGEHGGTQADDALADLWHWCDAHGLPWPDDLMELAEALNGLAGGALH